MLTFKDVSNRFEIGDVHNWIRHMHGEDVSELGRETLETDMEEGRCNLKYIDHLAW